MPWPHCDTCTCVPELPAVAAKQRDETPLTPPRPSIYPSPPQDRTAESSGAARCRRWWHARDPVADVAVWLLRIWAMLPDGMREHLLTLLQ